MTEHEATQCIKHLSTVFPDWAKWSATISKDTYVAWISALMSVEAHYVNAVIADWQFGRRQCPQTFERERVVYMAVEAARQLRSKDFERDNARQATKSYHQEAAEAAARRASYKPAMDRSMGNAMRQINQAADAIGKPKSQWTDEDFASYFSEVDKITESFARTLDKP